MSAWGRWRVGAEEVRGDDLQDARPARGGGVGATRRAVLTAGLAAITLPLLPSLLPRGARRAGTYGTAAAADQPVRLLWWYVPNGWRQPDLVPADVGPFTATPPLLAPLDAWRRDLTIVSGLDQTSIPTPPAVPHAMGTAAFLTGSLAVPHKVRAGVSVDQLAAQAHSGRTMLPSLVLAGEEGTLVGQCESGYSCAYYSNISWSSPTTPAGKLTSPRALFERMFGPRAVSTSREDMTVRARVHRSVLDHALEDLQALRSRVDASDRYRVDEYITGVRELELRLDHYDLDQCPVPQVPSDPPDCTSQIDLLTDLTVLALQCDLTRYVTFMMGEGGSSRPFPFLGYPVSHHAYAHHQNLPENLAALEVIQRWELERVAHLLQRLSSTPDGDGTLLDHCLVAAGSECADGAEHTMTGIAMFLAGRAGGRLQPGKHVAANGRPPADLWLAMLEAVDLTGARLGDAQGPLPGILG
jgi:hypothetical protein